MYVLLPENQTIKPQVNDLGAMELLPVRSFFAEALASLYVVSGQKAADQRARDLEERVPTARGNTEHLGDAAEEDDAAGGGFAGIDEAAVGAAGEGGASEPRPRRVRRFRS